MGYIIKSIITYLEAKIGKKLFPMLASREKKAWERDRVSHDVYAGTTKEHGK